MDTLSDTARGLGSPLTADASPGSIRRARSGFGYPGPALRHALRRGCFEERLRKIATSKSVGTKKAAQGIPGRPLDGATELAMPAP
jgi:hypothetical protein